MSEWGCVSRDDLLQWADAEGAPELLPQMFRRLVHETGRGVDAGSGVSLGGFDGFVRTTASSAFVPAGASGWELSVNKKAAQKASSDLAKRTELPDGSRVAEATYVQLIARPWGNAAQFGRDGTAAGPWREVRGYNVDRLANWLEQAPVTRLWFLEQAGRSPLGAWTASSW